MGKYIRKAKTREELAVMEVSQSSLGVRTRAKTLALQNSNSNSNSYLQLRSRRLQKPQPNVVANVTHHHHHHDSKRHKNSNATTTAAATTTANDNNSKEPHLQNHDEIVGVGVGVGVGEEDTNQQEDNHLINKTDFGVQEASFGENVLDFEARERSTRESTPCSLIRDPDNIRTPGSTTRPTCSTETNRRTQNATQRHIPTSHEIDEFFAGAEEEQQRQFVEKYNFDPVSDKPLPGRYEWEQLDP